jgi:hypothetical protein
LPFNNRAKTSYRFIKDTAKYFNLVYEVNIMAAITNERHSDFHWTPVNLTLSIIMGVAATAGLWLFTGLLLAVFLI